jgi:hypothetical protein
MDRQGRVTSGARDPVIAVTAVFEDAGDEAAQEEIARARVDRGAG